MDLHWIRMESRIGQRNDLHDIGALLSSLVEDD